MEEVAQDLFFFGDEGLDMDDSMMDSGTILRVIHAKSLMVM
jgi:hypothetical protein